jgi:hypothetical protein
MPHGWTYLVTHDQFLISTTNAYNRLAKATNQFSNLNNSH